MLVGLGIVAGAAVLSAMVLHHEFDAFSPDTRAAVAESLDLGGLGAAASESVRGAAGAASDSISEGVDRIRDSGAVPAQVSGIPDSVRDALAGP